MNLSADIDRLTDRQKGQVAAFIAVLLAPEPIPGLTMQQARIVHIVRAAGGKPVSRRLIADALGTTEAVVAKQAQNIRRRLPEGRRSLVSRQGLAWEAGV